MGAGAINYKKARFVASFRDPRRLPASTTPEVSFVGRSNVGKSSLLNRLFGRSKTPLAKVSSRPGKTATINFFDVDGVSFVDLPGYGFAQVSNAEREAYGELIRGYLQGERSHNLVVLLVDARHDPSALDCEMANALKERALPFVVALTKADKLSASRAASQKTHIAHILGVEVDDVIVTSATKGIGTAELCRRIACACLE